MTDDEKFYCPMDNTEFEKYCGAHCKPWEINNCIAYKERKKIEERVEALESSLDKHTTHCDLIVNGCENDGILNKLSELEATMKRIELHSKYSHEPFIEELEKLESKLDDTVKRIIGEVFDRLDNLEFKLIKKLRERIEKLEQGTIILRYDQVNEAKNGVEPPIGPYANLDHLKVAHEPPYKEGIFVVCPSCQLKFYIPKDFFENIKRVWGAPQPEWLRAFFTEFRRLKGVKHYSELYIKFQKEIEAFLGSGEDPQ